MDTQKKIELRNALRDHGIFLKDIALLCGCTIGNVSYVLSGQRSDRFDILKTSGELLHAKKKEVRKISRILEAA